MVRSLHLVFWALAVLGPALGHHSYDIIYLGGGGGKTKDSKGLFGNLLSSVGSLGALALGGEEALGAGALGGLSGIPGGLSGAPGGYDGEDEGGIGGPLGGALFGGGGEDYGGGFGGGGGGFGEAIESELGDLF